MKCGKKVSDLLQDDNTAVSTELVSKVDLE
jgi:hypothetical protein